MKTYSDLTINLQCAVVAASKTGPLNNTAFGTMGTLPLSLVTVSLTAPTVVAQCWRLASHTDSVALPQVLHPACIGSVLHRTLRCQRLHLELHTETVEHIIITIFHCVYCEIKL